MAAIRAPGRRITTTQQARRWTRTTAAAILTGRGSETGCLACDLTNGRRQLPGGQIWSTDHWVVEHCSGPLGVGTLIVKPRRHVAELDDAEAREMGPLLQRTTAAVTQLAKPDQVYVCLWSHGPVHIHFVVQPTNAALEAAWDAHGPGLQVAMFRTGNTPDEHEVGVFSDAAQRAFAAS